MENLMIFILLVSLAATVFFGITSFSNKKNVWKLLVVIIILIISLVLTTIVDNNKSTNYKNHSSENKVVDKPLASFKIINKNSLKGYKHKTDVDEDSDGNTIDDSIQSNTNENGYLTFKLKTPKNGMLKIQSGNKDNIETLKPGQSTISFNLNNSQSSKNLTINVSESGHEDREIRFTANNNSKEYLNNKKKKDEQQNKKNSEIEKEDRNNFDSYDTGSLKKKNEQNNLKDYKNDLKKVPSATKGAITDAYVDDNGSEQTVAVLSSDASMADENGLKSIAKTAYDTINSYVQTYKPFPDGSLADMIRIEDSSGNLVAKTSWGNFKFVG